MQMKGKKSVLYLLVFVCFDSLIKQYETVKFKFLSLVLLEEVVSLWLVQTPLKGQSIYWHDFTYSKQHKNEKLDIYKKLSNILTATHISCMRNLQQEKYVHIIFDYQNNLRLNGKCEKKMDNKNTAPLGFYIGMLQLVSKQVQIFWNKSRQIK